MPGKAMLDALIAYDAWGMNKLFDQAAGLAQEQLDAPTQYGRGSIRQILYHTVGALEVWATVLATGSRPAQRRTLEAFPTLDDVRRYAEEINGMARAALAHFSDEELAEVIAVAGPRGNVWQLARWQMLIQPLTHAMQHRAEVAAELTRWGRSPGDLDFVYFVIGT